MIRLERINCDTAVDLVTRLGRNPKDCTEDPANIKLVLTDDLFSDCREAYGFYTDANVLVGYAVTNGLMDSLDLLWVAPEYRRQGIATTALLQLKPAFTVCDKTNTPALNLYLSLGIEVEYAD